MMETSAQHSMKSVGSQTGYMIANSIVLPIAAWLGTRLGRRNLLHRCNFNVHIGVFRLWKWRRITAFDFLPNPSRDRGGALFTNFANADSGSFPPEKRGIAMAIFGMSVMVGPALGPTLGGYLTDNFGWRSNSFLNINVPLGLLAGFFILVKCSRRLLRTKERFERCRLDWFSVTLCRSGLLPIYLRAW